MTDLGRFADRKVVVTGAASGIGRATARRLLDEGARVIAVDRGAEGLDSLAAETDTSRLETVAADLASTEGLGAVVAAAGSSLDGLANIAGIPDGLATFDETDDELWDRVIGVNLTAMFRLTRDLMPALRQGSSPSVVNCASAAGRRGSAAGMAYTVSKHGVIGLTRSATFMHGPEGIRFNAIAPGPVATNIDMAARSQLGLDRVMSVGALLAPSVAQPEDIASPIAYLLSTDSSEISGTVLHVDGGLDAY